MYHDILIVQFFLTIQFLVLISDLKKKYIKLHEINKAFFE